jgi:pimeloyl-ACP methyl ester carboxylesterase
MLDVLLRLSLFLAAGFLLWLIFITWMTIRWLIHPPRRTVAWAVSRSRPSLPSELIPPLPFHEFTVESHGARLTCWHITGSAPAAPTLLVCHGWGDSRFTMLECVSHLAPLFSSVLVWDLPGHGTSTGTSSLGTREHNHIPDLIAALPADPSRTISLYGYSLGAGIALTAASQWDRALPPLRNLIIQAPYRFPITPAANVMNSIAAPWRLNLRLALACIGIDLGYGPSFARSPRFDRATLAANVSAPTLILHGTADTVCPLADSQAIAAALASSTLAAIENAGHTDLWSRPETRQPALAAIHTLLA